MGNSTSKLADPREWKKVRNSPSNADENDDELELFQNALDADTNNLVILQESLDMIRASCTVSPILLDQIARTHQKLVSLLHHKAHTLRNLSQTAFDLLRCGSINLCSFASFEEVLETLGPTHQQCMRCVPDVTLKTSDFANAKTYKNGIDWEADHNTYLFRTNLVYHQLPTGSAYGSFESLFDDEFLNCDQLGNFRYTFLLLNSSNKEEEEGILDFLFIKDLFGLPSIPFGVLIPTFLSNEKSKISQSRSHSLFTARLMKLEDGKMKIELSPFLKILMLLRIELLANILIEKIEFLHAMDERFSYDFVSAGSIILQHLKAATVAFNILRSDSSTFKEQLLEKQLEELCEKQSVRVGLALRNMCQKLLSKEYGWAPEWFLGNICTMNTDFWSKAFPSDWRAELCDIAESAGAQMAAQPVLERPKSSSYEYSDRSWIREKTTQNLPMRIRWLMKACEQMGEPRVTQKCMKTEYLYNAQNLAFFQFVILPAQMRELLICASKDCQTGDTSLLEQWVKLLPDAFQTILRVVQRGYHSTSKRDSKLSGGFWNDLSWNDSFHLTLSYNSSWNGFQMFDREFTDFVPPENLTRNLKSIFDAIRSPAVKSYLTQNQFSSLKSLLKFYYNAFNAIIKPLDLYSHHPKTQLRDKQLNPQSTSQKDSREKNKLKSRIEMISQKQKFSQYSREAAAPYLYTFRSEEYQSLENKRISFRQLRFEIANRLIPWDTPSTSYRNRKKRVRRIKSLLLKVINSILKHRIFVSCSKRRIYLYQGWPKLSF